MTKTGCNLVVDSGPIIVISLAFVYHNVVPVVVSSLEGDIGKIRAALAAGVALPFVMFTAWDGAILGAMGSLG